MALRVKLPPAMQAFYMVPNPAALFLIQLPAMLGGKQKVLQVLGPLHLGERPERSSWLRVPSLGLAQPQQSCGE